jgi:hypothetical protein
MGRVLLVAGLWFAFWMSLGLTIGVLSKGMDGMISGAMNGAYFATLLSFAWPWLMPESINRWMDG